MATTPLHYTAPVQFFSIAVTAHQSPHHCLTSFPQEFLASSRSGAYLPLSVYAQRGFDPKEIEERCTDTQMHAVLGKCYRVAITALDKSSMEDTIREQVLTSMKKVKPDPSSSSVVTAAPAAVHQDHDSDVDGSSSSTSASSSSSSSVKRKKKSHKKSKKEKKHKKSKKAKLDSGKPAKSGKEDHLKAAEDQKRKAQKALDDEAKQKKKAGVKIHKDCEKVMSKLGVPIYNCEQDAAHRLFTKIAGFASSESKAVLKHLQVMQREAQQKLATSALTVTPLSFDFAAADRLVKDCQKTSALVRQMLVAAEGHFK